MHSSLAYIVNTGSDETERQAFQERLAELTATQLVWVDECGLEQGLYRLQARCPRGVPVLADIHDRRFVPRISVIAAYNQQRLQVTLRFEGSMNTAVGQLYVPVKWLSWIMPTFINLPKRAN